MLIHTVYTCYTSFKYFCIISEIFRILRNQPTVFKNRIYILFCVISESIPASFLLWTLEHFICHFVTIFMMSIFSYHRNQDHTYMHPRENCWVIALLELLALFVCCFITMSIIMIIFIETNLLYANKHIYSIHLLNFLA